MPYAELEESSTDDENFENCHLTAESRWHDEVRCNTEARDNLIVLDPAALQDEARSMRFPGIVNVDNSDVDYGPHVTTVNNTLHESGARETSSNRLRNVLKETTVTERVSFSIITLLILFCTILGVYYVVSSEVGDEKPYDPKTWCISRAMWMASPVVPYNNTPFRRQYQPVRLVIIQQSESTACYDFSACCAAMRAEQQRKLAINEDTPYNFFIGNDGLVYEGMGWLIQGTHSDQYDPCSISIGFIGDYREYLLGHDTVMKLQLNRTFMLLDYGVNNNYLHPEYRVMGAKDFQSTGSPGSNLYKEIKKWEHYDNNLEYRRLTCDQIHALNFSDDAPHEWRISRDMWEAKPYNNTEWSPAFRPIRLVIIQHSVSSECHNFPACKIKLQKLQNYYIWQNEDIPYNFVVGNDGRIYEGRGWAVHGINSGQYNPCAVSIGFLGNYDEGKLTHSILTENQLNHTLLLLEEGLRDGHLHHNYVIAGAKDLKPTISPGSLLYSAIQKLEHYDRNRYINKTCEEIYID